MITFLLWGVAAVLGWLFVGILTGVFCLRFQFPWKIPREEAVVFPLLGPFATFVVVMASLGMALRWVNDHILERAFERTLHGCEALMLWVLDHTGGGTPP